MIATLQPSPLDQWRQRFGGQRAANRCRRPLAAMGYLVHGPIYERLVEVEKLVFVVLHDVLTGKGQNVLRLAGYSGARVPWGVKWGGAGRCRFSKNLLLQPVPNGPGLRLSAASDELLRLGLRLDSELDRQRRYSTRPARDQVRLPCLWAGFRPVDADSITGAGPELESYAGRTGKMPQRVLEDMRREYCGLVLYPFSWVSHYWQQAVAVFADLERFPRRQVFVLSDAGSDLVGFQDVAEYDFYHSQFDRAVNRRSCRRRRTATVPR